ncbi:type VI secretion system baseplate subunit TssF [Paracoccus aminophilus]|uniref:Type VI secretion system protein ImpG n=1 Tax=Paracoccus aminophilus JCM 7686 TaxID=1367847 RepID=S5Z257_PARAH|nr:type VI secretion system baseplate subunit TssF [Paracoccus aminophilus]AGT11486.1 type VI secretion system protein ImpG [Paracoccus aminophilus JCM 7686]
MRKAFRDAYNRELALLYERSSEFAAEYPGLADRLGGLLRENTDPWIAGLLEGTAFMAARVQLKLDEEFLGFTQELLDQIFPEALAPIPSVMLIQARVAADRRDLEEGLHFAPGEYMDARFRDADQRVSCQFSLCAPLEIWPLELTGAAYHDRPAVLGSLGQDPLEKTRAGLQIDLRHQTGSGLADLKLDDLTVHLTGSMPHAVALYEQIHCDCLRISLRYLSAQGDPVFVRIPTETLSQIGFNRDENLFQRDDRLFSGFSLLRDQFVFPRKFLGFKLSGLQKILRRIRASEAQLIIEFGRADDELAKHVDGTHLRLFCAPAVNLFEESSNQVRLDDRRFEYVVTPDSSPLTHYEVQRILKVYASYGTARTRVELHPLYSLPPGQVAQRNVMFYTSRRRPRRLTEGERQTGLRHDYRGTETYITIYEPPEVEPGARAQRLHIKTLCSNRHLPAYLPIAGSDDFRMTNDVGVSLDCVAGPTRPREPMTEIDREGPHRLTQGEVHWRLISYLGLNHFGLDDRGDGDSASALRELVSLFADLSDNSIETQIAGIKELTTRPVVRSIRREDGYFPARGLEISVTYDEAAFEGSGIIVLAAVLDRFFAEYANVNSFTQSVTISQQRGVIKRWPPRNGKGPLL